MERVLEGTPGVVAVQTPGVGFVFGEQPLRRAVGVAMVGAELLMSGQNLIAVEPQFRL